MVDSRAKGSRGEYLVRDLLRQHTGLPFERVPNSGALSYLKGDLYIPHETNRFCIEVKNYEDSPLTDKIFTNKSNYIAKWWEKLLGQAEHGGQEPLLMFKYNRSQVFVVTELEPKFVKKYMYIAWLDCYIALAKEWLEKEEIKWVKPSPN
jgi:Holliday junction resolvase